MIVGNEKLPWDIFLNSKFFAKYIFNQETTFKFDYLIEIIYSENTDYSGNDGP